jgi:uncharacterized protein (TIGR03086 family)
VNYSKVGGSIPPLPTTHFTAMNRLAEARRTTMSHLDLTPATSRIGSLVASVRDDQLDDPTPLPAYRVRELLDHIGGVARAFTCAARKERNELTDRVPTDPSQPLDPEWRTVIPRDLEVLAAAWADPLAWEGTTRIAAGDNPASVVGLVVTDELVIHGWDLARALGAEYDADPDLIAGARDFLDLVAQPDLPEGDRVPFGPPKPVPADASPLDEVLLLCGRDLTWTR